MLATTRGIRRSATVDNEAAWHDRLRYQGHTGWNDPVVYAWDQIERLHLVERVVRELGLDPARSSALDFGCGIGDFCRMLLGLGFSVIGHDPVAVPAIDHPRFCFEADFGPRVGSPPRVDLVLSVTVLDHVLDDEHLQLILSSLRCQLRRRGFFVMLEYALSGSFRERPDLRSSGHQAFRSIDAWRSALTAGGFEILREIPVPHPGHAPSRGYLRYARHPVVRMLRRSGLAQTPFARALLARVARRIASREQAGLGPADESPLVCAVCVVR